MGIKRQETETMLLILRYCAMHIELVPDAYKYILYMHIHYKQNVIESHVIGSGSSRAMPKVRLGRKCYDV